MAESDSKKPEPVQGEPFVVKHPKPPDKPVVAPDGHEVVTKEDIANRG